MDTPLGILADMEEILQEPQRQEQGKLLSPFFLSIGFFFFEEIFFWLPVRP